MVQYIVFMADVQIVQIGKLRQAITDAVNNNQITEIYLCISSNGGLVTEGLSLAAFIRSIPKDVTTHNFSVIDSVANVIFASGKKRYCTDTASFLFHGVTLPINQALTENQLIDSHKGVVRLRESIATNIAAYTGLKVADINALMISGDTILSATEALTKGIINAIQPVNIPQGANIISIGNA